MQVEPRADVTALRERATERLEKEDAEAFKVAFQEDAALLSIVRDAGPHVRPRDSFYAICGLLSRDLHVCSLRTTKTVLGPVWRRIF